MKDKICIESYYDGWSIIVGGTTKIFRWDHDENEKGVGGEKVFAAVLRTLGYEVKVKDVY